MSEAEVLERMKKIDLFSQIKQKPEAMQLLIEISKLRKYHKGDVIICENDMGDEMFIVIKGGVEIQKKTRAGDSYTVVQLRAEHNVFFGELALIDDDKRSATVIASEDSEFLVLHKNDFIKLGNDHPEVGLPVTREIAKNIAVHLRKTTGDMLTIFDALVSEIRE